MKKFLSSFFATILLLALAGGAVFIALFPKNEPPKPGHSSTEGTAISTDSAVSKTETDVISSDRSSDSNTEQTTDTVTDTDTDSQTSSAQKNPNTNTDTDTPTQKRIAFTLDDGPHYLYTRVIADLFYEYNGKCTYFVVGNRVHGSQQQAMEYAASLGHEVGIHGYTHKLYFNKCTDAEYLTELRQTEKAINDAAGICPTLMRPPGGHLSAARAAASTYSLIMWNVDPHDWEHKKENQENVDRIVQNVLDNVKDGNIILMHDIYKNTTEAVRILLPLLEEQGYEFVTVSELLGEEKKPGVKYFKAP